MEPITTSAITAFLTTLATKGADAPAKTFNNIWEYVFGPLNSFLEKSIEQRKTNLIDFAQKIHDETKDIPPENIKEPELSLLGPALEASKFYIDKEIIRDMFAKLIAQSFDNRKTGLIHHSYVEIIKQLNPNDAKIFSDFKNPTMLLYYESNPNGEGFVIENIYLPNAMTDFSREDCISIGNLERLGLIHVVRYRSAIVMSYPKANELIDIFKRTRIFHEVQQSSPSATPKIVVEPANITEFGWNFKRACL